MLQRPLEVTGKSPADCLDERFEVGLFAEGGGGVVLERHRYFGGVVVWQFPVQFRRELIACRFEGVRDKQELRILRFNVTIQRNK